MSIDLSTAAACVAAVASVVSIGATFLVDGWQARRAAHAENRAIERETETRRLSDERAALSERREDDRIAEQEAARERRTVRDHNLNIGQYLQLGGAAVAVYEAEIERITCGQLLRFREVHNDLMEIAQRANTLEPSDSFSPSVKIAAERLKFFVDPQRLGGGALSKSEWDRSLKANVAEISKYVRILAEAKH